MKKIVEKDYYEEDLYEVDDYEYSLEDIEKLEDAGAFDYQKLTLQLALDELEELRGDDVLF